MLFCHVVITVCACTFVTCTLIKINQSINTMCFGSTAFIDAEMFNTLLTIRTMLVLVRTCSRGFRPGDIFLGVCVRGVTVRGFRPGGVCPLGLMSGHQSGHGANWHSTMCKVLVRLSLRAHQDSVFYRLEVLLTAQPTVSKH